MPIFIRLKILVLIAFLGGSLLAKGQTLGGVAAYNFMRLPATPLLTAAGGVNVSYETDDAGLAANNPALLHLRLHGQLALGFNAFLAGIRQYSASGAFHHERSSTSFGGQINFLHYGQIEETDASGNIMGSFRPVDFVVQASAARNYRERWQYGLTVKWIHSSYQQYGSSAIAFDAGVLYRDSANGFTASLLAKNMGFQLASYAGEPQDLPFDLQAGFTKRLSKSPFGFSVTAQHLHRFDISYRDTVFNNENDITGGNGFFSKLMNHFTVAAHIYVGSHLEGTIGYNHLRRNELSMGDSGNGLSGFAAGLRVKYEKLQVQLAHTTYQRGISHTQLGLNLQLARMFGH